MTKKIIPEAGSSSVKNVKEESTSTLIKCRMMEVLIRKWQMQS